MAAKERNIKLMRGQKFTIVLESNPTSGFRWFPTFDKSIIDLISHVFQPSSSRGIGRAGNDVFTFLAINHGTDELKMIYKRSWEKQSAAEKLFLIEVE